MASPRALRVLNTRAGWPAGAREAATGAEEVAAFDDAGAGDARHLGSSHPDFILLVVPDEALDVLIAAARAGGKMLALGEAATTRDLVLSRTSWEVPKPEFAGEGDVPRTCIHNGGSIICQAH